MIARVRAVWIVFGVAAAVASSGCGGGPRPAPPLRNEPPTRPVDPAPLDRERDPTTPPRAASDAALPTARLPNGLATLLVPWRDDWTDTAEIALGIEAGAMHGRPAVAELAARLLLETSDPNAGRIELRRAIAQLGGSIAAEVGLATTWITLRVPRARWQDALRELGRALLASPPGRTQLARIHDELLQLRIGEVFSAPERTMATSLMLGFEGSSNRLEALQSRDPAEAVLFQARRYRPDRALLALRVPAEPEAVETATERAFGTWSTAGDEEPAASDARQPPSGLFWAAGPGPSRAVLLLAMPPASDPKALALQSLWNGVTMEGSGGRLETLLRERGIDVVWEGDRLHLGEREAVVLATTTTPELAVRAFDAVRDTLRALHEQPLSANERKVAIGRTRLTARRSFAAEAEGLQSRAALQLAGVDHSQQEQRLEALDRTGVLDGALPELLDLPLAMVVLGGKPPETARDVTEFLPLPPSLMARVGGVGGLRLVQQALPWLARASEALGGRDRLAAIRGFRCTSTTSTAGSPPTEESLAWTTAGTLALTRTVLGQTISTTIEGSEWSESLGEEKVVLSPTEVRWRMQEAERFPLALLAAAARGELQFRLMSTRKVEDREHVVLEAVGDRFERLRIQLDSESALVRVVEQWTTAPDGAPTYLVDTWSDYRQVGPLRVPHLRETSIDDGQGRRITTFETFAIE